MTYQTYQPWAYKPTQTLYNLFQEKFGKVWIQPTIPSVYLHDSSDGDVPIYIFPRDMGDPDIVATVLYDRFRHIAKLPVLTLSALCDFVDVTFAGKQNPFFEPLIAEKLKVMQLVAEKHNDYDDVKSYTSSVIRTIANEMLNVDPSSCLVTNHLKHFALDNWDEPEKIIEEFRIFIEY